MNSENMAPSSGDLALVKARALASAGRMAWFQADFSAARTQLEESLRLFQWENDLVGTLEAISSLILVLTRQGAIPEGLTLLAKANLLLESLRQSENLLPVLAGLGRAAAFMVDAGSLPFARPWCEEAAHLAREAGDKRSLAWALDGLAIYHYYSNDLPNARADLEEGIPLLEELGDRWGVSLEKWLLANIARREGNWDEARELNRQAITVQSQNNSRQGLPYMIDSFAYLAIEENQPQRAVRLLAASQAMSDRIGNIVQPLYRIEHEKYLSASRAQLAVSEWKSLWNQGRLLSTEAAVALALENTDPSS